MSYVDGLLATNERVIRRERQHWMFPVVVAGRWVAIAVGIVVVGFILIEFVLKPSGDGGVIDSTVGFIQTVVGILTWLALAFAVIGLIWSAVRWQSQEYVLTDRRVVHVYGVINKQALDSSLENITDAQIQIPWLGRMMGYGNLTLMTPSESGISKLELLQDPIEFKRDMMDAKHSLLIEINTPRFTSPPIHAPSGAAPQGTDGRPPMAPPVAAAPVGQAQPAPVVDAASAQIPFAAEDEAAGWIGGPAPVSAGASAPAAPAQPAPPAAAPPPAAVPAAPPAAAPASPSSEDTTRTLAALADLRDRGAITPEEYEAKKAELLERL
jgi:hypothetical protein